MLSYTVCVCVFVSAAAAGLRKGQPDQRKHQTDRDAQARYDPAPFSVKKSKTQIFMWCDSLVHRLTRCVCVFVSELEHLQEQLQTSEAEEKENRQVELQRSVRSKRGKVQKKEELGESELVQEDANVSHPYPKKSSEYL